MKRSLPVVAPPVPSCIWPFWPIMLFMPEFIPPPERAIAELPVVPRRALLLLNIEGLEAEERAAEFEARPVVWAPASSATSAIPKNSATTAIERFMASLRAAYRDQPRVAILPHSTPPGRVRFLGRAETIIVKRLGAIR